VKNKYFRKKRVLRATTMTVCLVSFLLLFDKAVGETNTILLMFMIVSCVLLDFVVLKLLKSKHLEKYFFEVEKV
jgi:hypothetical protein